MRTVTRFPRKVRVEETVWIPMSDGKRLCARIWLPEDAEADPVPAVVEYIPYRRRDGTRLRDDVHHAWFAGHGYASVRLEIRGSGDSEGLLADEYLKQEQDDAVEAIAWLAAQPWCAGTVGMMGISWGGFNGLQVAARRPPALKAIITVASTDDRYNDDCHYMGGCLLNNSLGWGSVFFLLGTMPPDPATVGEDAFRAMWQERIDNLNLPIEGWLRHQAFDAFWQHGSVSMDYGAIEAAVYAIGGWADGYSNAVPRLLANLKGPKKGLVGPWAHAYPDHAEPGPQIGFLQEALRWWDRWLKGIENGVMDEPEYRVWMQDSVPPATTYPERPGRWVAEESWPSPRIETKRHHLGTDGRLAAKAARRGSVTVASPLAVGVTWGEWCPYGFPGQLPDEQREEDGRSVCFDTSPLGRRTEILGAPVIELDVACDKPQGLLCARICDVAPDGASTFVTYGLLNLSHRDGHGTPRPLEPGRRYRIRLQLNDIAHVFPRGHRIRLALSTSYWPMVWPSPEMAAVTVELAGSTLDLPVRPPRQEDRALVRFAAPENAAAVPHTVTRQGSRDRTVTHRAASGAWLVEIKRDGGALTYDDTATTIGGDGWQRYSLTEGDPLSARSEIAGRWTWSRDGRRIETEQQTALTCTATDFVISARIAAYENGVRIATRSWDAKIPRNGV